VKNGEELYLDIKVIITPFLESGVKSRVKLVTGTFLNLHKVWQKYIQRNTFSRMHPIKYQRSLVMINYSLMFSKQTFFKTKRKNASNWYFMFPFQGLI